MKKKSLKKFLSVLLSVVMIGSVVSGCSLVTVDPEKDNAQTLITIGDDTTVTKSVFNNYMAIVEMSYVGSGSNMPTGKDLEEIKESVLNSVVQDQILAYKGRADGEKVDEAAAKKEGEEAYRSTKESAGKSYELCLKNWNTNDEAFKAYMIQNAVDSEYAEAAKDAFNESVKKDPDSYLKKAVGTVNNEEITRGEYNYYMIGANLNHYMTNSAGLDATDEKVMKQTNDEIFTSIGKNHAYIKYCEENKIDITKDDIAAEKKTLESNTSMFFQEDSQLEEFVENYNLTLKQYKAYQEGEAKANAAASAIKKKMTDDSEVSDKEIESYFKEHQTEYDESTVSACHILTSDQKLSTEIYNAAKDCKDKAAFQKVMDQYKDNESVQEATDLGAFDHTKMVAEFTKQSFSMDVNTVSKPVKTEFGYHVIFVYDKKEVENKLDDHKDEIKKTLQEEKGEKAFESFDEDLSKQMKPSYESIKVGIEDYIESLKEELKVTVHDDVI